LAARVPYREFYIVHSDGYEIYRDGRHCLV
jgi:hypothetical protein